MQNRVAHIFIWPVFNWPIFNWTVEFVGSASSQAAHYQTGGMQNMAASSLFGRSERSETAPLTAIYAADKSATGIIFGCG